MQSFFFSVTGVDLSYVAYICTIYSVICFNSRFRSSHSSGGHVCPVPLVTGDPFAVGEPGLSPFWTWISSTGVVSSKICKRESGMSWRNDKNMKQKYERDIFLLSARNITHKADRIKSRSTASARLFDTQTNTLD